MTTPLPTFTLDARETLESELIRKLMDYFISSGLRPGSKLPSERRLSEALSVGRAALRHALKSLSLLGVVEVRPSTGTFLRNEANDLLPQVIEWGLLLGERRTGEVIEARSTLEVVLSQLAAARRSDQDVEDLRQLTSRMRQASSATEYVQWDVEFHLAIARVAQNDVLAGILRSLQTLLHVWATRVITAAGETESSFAMHTPILDAITDGDVERAGLAMQAHMDRASRRLRAAIEAEVGIVEPAS